MACGETPSIDFDEAPHSAQAVRASNKQASPSSPSPAHRFNLYGFQPDPRLSADENYLDIVFLITRSVQDDGQQGHMGALIVRPCQRGNVGGSQREGDDGVEGTRPATMPHYTDTFYQNILGAATNTPLFGTKDCTSDIHAEINALGQASRSAQSSEGCTAYITIPPCKRCFAALVTFGVGRIVTRQESPRIIRETAHARGMVVHHLSVEEKRRQMQRMNRLVNPHRTDEELMETAERVKRHRQRNKMAAKKERQEVKNPKSTSEW